MAAITDLSDLINLQTGGNNGNLENIFFHKVPRVAGVAATAPMALLKPTPSIQSVQLTATAGNFGITLARPIAWLPVDQAGTMGWRDYTTGLPGIPEIEPNSCLSLTATELFGCLATVQKSVSSGGFVGGLAGLTFSNPCITCAVVSSSVTDPRATGTIIISET
jgi:hypothetical protein